MELKVYRSLCNDVRLVGLEVLLIQSLMGFTAMIKPVFLLLCVLCLIDDACNAKANVCNLVTGVSPATLLVHHTTSSTL